jgi:hypothetical protein
MLMKKVSNRMNKLLQSLYHALLVINPCAHKLTSPKRLNSCKRNQEHKQE